MAVAFNTATSGAIQGASSCTVAHTVSAGANNALWVWAVCWNSTDYLAGATVTFNGTSLGSPILSLTTVVNATVYAWQMAAPPVGTANAVVTPTSSAYLDVWVQSASGVDQALLANVAGVASTMTQFATSPATKSVAVPSGGACMSFMAYRNTGASVLTPSGVTANGTPPGSSYAHTAFGVSQSISSYGWSWTNGSAGADIISMHALPVNAASGGGDATAPTLTSPTGSAAGSTTATVGATTDEGNGTLYAVVTTSATAPTKAQVKAGQNAAGTAANWSGSVAVSSTGAKTLSATGLTASTTYYAHLMHEDAATNQANVVSSTSFTTSAGSSAQKGRFYYQFGSPQC